MHCLDQYPAWGVASSSSFAVVYVRHADVYTSTHMIRQIVPGKPILNFGAYYVIRAAHAPVRTRWHAHVWVWRGAGVTHRLLK